jgi:hypothetical protein
MLIKNYEIQKPDSDGDRSIELTFEVENKYDEDVMLVKHEAFHFNDKGFLIASDLRNSQECCLEKGDTEELSGWGNIHEMHLAAGESATVQVQTRFFKREFFKLSPLTLSESEGVTLFEAEVETKIIENKIKITIVRRPPDSDGNVHVGLMAQVKNQTSAYLEAAEMRVSLRDRAGAEIDNTSTSNDLPPHSATVLDPSFWGLKTKKLKGASLEISLTIYEQIGTETFEATS